MQVPGEDGTRLQVPQIAPGRYECVVPSQAQPQVVALLLGEKIVDAVAIAGRYPEEFENLGNNRENMNLIAQRTSGRVIEPMDHAPIDFHWPKRDVDLTPVLCTAAAALLAVVAILWRMA